MNSMMEYQGYHAKVEFSAEDGAFIGKVFGITDTLIFDGETVTEITEMFHQTIDDYIKLCQENGKIPEKEFKGSFNIRISPETHRRIALTAEQKNVSINQVVNDAIESFLDENKGTHGHETYIIQSAPRRGTYLNQQKHMPAQLEGTTCLNLVKGARQTYGR